MQDDSLNIMPGKDESCDTKDDNKSGTYGLILVAFLLIIIGLHYLALDYRRKSPSTSGVYCRRLLEAVQESTMSTSRVESF